MLLTVPIAGFTVAESISRGMLGPWFLFAIPRVDRSETRPKISHRRVWSFIFGVFTSTAFSLLVVPVVY